MYDMGDREEFYMNKHFPVVDQLSRRTNNLKLFSYYREQVEPRRR